jgi:hypothetical protein
MHFRIGNDTFQLIVDSLIPYIERQVTNFRIPIPVNNEWQSRYGAYTGSRISTQTNISPLTYSDIGL